MSKEFPSRPRGPRQLPCAHSGATPCARPLSAGDGPHDSDPPPGPEFAKLAKTGGLEASMTNLQTPRKKKKKKTRSSSTTAPATGALGGGAPSTTLPPGDRVLMIENRPVCDRYETWRRNSDCAPRLHHRPRLALSAPSRHWAIEEPPGRPDRPGDQGWGSAWGCTTRRSGLRLPSPIAEISCDRQIRTFPRCCSWTPSLSRPRPTIAT